MIPTERGKELYSQVVQALEKLEQVSQNLRSADTSQLPLLRLGSPLEYFHEMVLPRLANAPLRWWVQFGVTQSLVEELAHDKLDLVIATQRILMSEIEYSVLEEERYLLVGAREIVPPAINEESPEALTQLERWLAAQRWISYGAELPIIRRFWQQHFNLRPDIQPVLVIPNLHAIEKAVEQGYGLSVLPEYLCRAAIDAGRLHVVWRPSEPTVNELWLAYRKIDRHNVEIKQALQILRATEQ
jgi:DNA-binding transcriptional LysR family regulator